MATVDDLTEDELNVLVLVDIKQEIENALAPLRAVHAPSDRFIAQREAVIARVNELMKIIEAGWGTAIAAADAILNPEE